MAIIPPALSVVFVAFCLWLTVRIFNRRELWAKWTAAGVIVLGYPLAYGPAYWTIASGFLPEWACYLIMLPFIPLLFLAQACEPVMGFIQWYLSLWIAS